MPLAWRLKIHGCQPQPPFPGQGLRFGRHSSPCLGDEQLSRHLALRNKNIHPVYCLSEGMRIILEHDVADMDTILRMFKTSQQALLSVLIIHLMNLIDSFQTDFHILLGIEEVHELLPRRVELSDDILPQFGITSSI